jgi:S-adenosylmethionine:tRNA ribosyltransferase-isomerase
VRLADFDYPLPPDRIAQRPAEPRDAARLLVDRGDPAAAAPLDLRVRELPGLLAPGDLLVVNDTRVMPARLRLLRRSGGAVEVLLLEPRDGARERWEALVRPGGKVRDGEELLGADGATVALMGPRTAAGDTFEVLLRPGAGRAVDELLASRGEVPLPPYITTPLGAPERYQTVYAREGHSAAAPTAGLHFTPGLLDALEARGVSVARVELTVGLDTFQPVVAPDPSEHAMHSEAYRVPPETLAACHATRARGGRVVAVGTTAVRALESAARGESAGRTRLFIHRGFEFALVDRLLTNFHLPRTTLLMMIDAFVGPRWRGLYAHAIARDYRMLSFGDAMLLDRHLR